MRCSIRLRTLCYLLTLNEIKTIYFKVTPELSMLCIRRLTQLLIALCASAFLSALISFGIYHVLSITALPSSSSQSDFVNAINSVEDIKKLKESIFVFINAAFDLREKGASLVKWGLGFVLVWSLILGSVALATYRQICKHSSTPTPPEVENFIDLALSGKLELWKVFWGGYVALSALVFLISGGVLQWLVPTGSTKSSFLFNVLVGPIALSIPATIYLFSALLVWKSAPNTSSVAWHYLAKTVVIVNTVIPLLKSIMVASAILR